MTPIYAFIPPIIITGVLGLLVVRNDTDGVQYGLPGRLSTLMAELHHRSETASQDLSTLNGKKYEKRV